MEPIRRIKGTDDILPPESLLWQKLTSIIRKVMSLYNYQEIIMPVFEYSELFARGIGTSTDIVSKEMYTLVDKGGRNVTLRPEGTASVVRAYIEHSLGSKSPVVKLYYIGPMFRQERPQKGRRRQFNQFGIEILGAPSPLADVEGISLNLRILSEIGIHNSKLMINSIGDSNCRGKYRSDLTGYLEKRFDRLCGDCQERYRVNALRVFDCKNESCQIELRDAPLMLDYLCEGCREHFDLVKKGLEKHQIDYSINSRLVRGLDYYTRTVFEIVSSEIGSQDSLSGGGRYDLLVEELGGKSTPAFGFAAGMERMLLAWEQNSVISSSLIKLDCFLAAPKGIHLTQAAIIAEKIRDEGISVEVDLLGRSLKSELKEANRLNARLVIILGEDEASRGVCLVRDMVSSVQWEEPSPRLVNSVVEYISKI
ncbi:MAG: histidine--tRNA ligase [candidate division Zixibacteria bacterium CG_4_9_14_3_um_filter_46_8]|nr:MAG: histidine--tRNA ligase [candidate division Zixibacteria bacterium CG_4_9_14_3_um_filter_46_8]